jgi:hypothetical protein
MSIKNNSLPSASNLITFVVLLFVGFLITSSMTMSHISNNNSSSIEAINNNAIDVEMMNIIKMNIIDEMDKYVDNVAPGSELNNGILFELCNKYNVDVIFVLAQGQVESHFATKGTAKKTKSIFNVGAYDGHSAAKQKRNGFGYNNANESIEPYLKLLTNNYLIDGKTETDMMINYVNNVGQRYASNPKYEKMLRNVYNRISSNTNLTNLISKYNHYKNN